jgi:hypothetical protein
MNTKIAALFLLALLSLGVTGFASAWWTAELKVTGTVTTGTFGMEWSLDHYVITGDPKHIITGTGVTLADYKTDTVHPQTLAIDLHDVYPCTDLEIWCDIDYYGSVPGNISRIDFVGTLNGNLITNFTNWMFDEIKITGISSELTAQNHALTIGSFWKLPYTDPAQVLGDIRQELIGLQWHSGYHINFEIFIHWTEYGMHFWDPWGTYWYENRVGAEVPQGATLAFTLTFNVVQYNSPP